jgi:hypothetical protein
VPGDTGIDGNETADQSARTPPHIHLWNLSLPLAYLQRLPGKQAGNGYAQNMTTKNHFWTMAKQVENYSI